MKEKLKYKMLEANKNHHKEFCDVVASGLKFFDATQLCFGHVDFDGNMVAFNTDVALWEYYIEKELYVDDPCVCDISFIENGAEGVWSIENPENYTDYGIQAFSKLFGVDQGVGVIEKHESGLFGFSFGGPLKNKEMVNRILGYSQVLKQFKNHVINWYVKNHDAFASYAVHMPTLKGDSFYKGYLDGDNPARVHEFYKSIGYVREKDFELMNVELSRLEFQFAKLFYMGVSAKTASNIMNTTYEAARAHLARISRKFRSKNKQALREQLNKVHALGYFIKPSLKEGNKKEIQYVGLEKEGAAFG